MTISNNYTVKLERAKVLLQEVADIYSREDIPAEEYESLKAQAEAKVAEADRLKSECINLKEIEDQQRQIDSQMEIHTKAQDAKQRQTPSDWKTFGEFAKAVSRFDSNGVLDPRLQYVNDAGDLKEGKALVENVGASGGFLVPTEFRAELMALAQANAIVRPRATVIPMSRRSMQIPVLSQTDTTSGTPAWFGGIFARWTEEAAQKTEQSPTFRQIDLVAHKLTLYTRSSDEMLDDSAISLEAFLMGRMGFPGAIAWQEDLTFINGTGAGQPQGVITAGGTITVDRVAQLAIGYDDLTRMLENFMPSANGVWIITQSAMSDLLQMSGPAGNPSFVWGNATTGAPNTLLGMPVIWSEMVPRIGTAGDVILADWSFYLIGDRQNTVIDSSIHDRFQFDQTSWRAVHRVDGQEWLSTPLTYQDGTTQISPFVILGDKTT